MAQIDFEELVSVLKRNPSYRERWELGTPADEALDIRFGRSDSRGVRSEVFETVAGFELVLDLDADGRVVGIEII